MVATDAGKKVLVKLSEMPFRTEIPNHEKAVAWALCNPEICGNEDIKIVLTELFAVMGSRNILKFQSRIQFSSPLRGRLQ